MRHEQDDRHERQLRFTFVAMLFALTIGQIAIQFAQLIHTGVCYYPAYAHLLLATFIVVTSWVGWAQSKAPGNVRPVRKIFSWEFLILLVDVFLVFFYFIIVKGVEMPKPKTEIKASAANEATWMIVVFAGYLTWDFLTKVVIKPQSDSSFWNRLSGSYFLINLAITGGCLLLAIIIKILSLGVSSNVGVILVDALLLALVFAFRAFKQFVGREGRPTSVY